MPRYLLTSSYDTRILDADTCQDAARAHYAPGEPLFFQLHEYGTTTRVNVYRRTGGSGVWTESITLSVTDPDHPPIPRRVHVGTQQPNPIPPRPTPENEMDAVFSTPRMLAEIAPLLRTPTAPHRTEPVTPPVLH